MLLMMLSEVVIVEKEPYSKMGWINLDYGGRAKSPFFMS